MTSFVQWLSLDNNEDNNERTSHLMIAFFFFSFFFFLSSFFLFSFLYLFSFSFFHSSFYSFAFSFLFLFLFSFLLPSFIRVCTYEWNTLINSLQNPNINNATKVLDFQFRQSGLFFGCRTETELRSLPELTSHFQFSQP